MAESPSEHRSKRQRVDKGGRFAALQKLKDLKGQKHKYTVNEEIDSVYDVVDENEFAKRAREQYGSDWIEDDGTGYLEDGRDFFEDDEEQSGGEQTSKAGKKKGKKRPREGDIPAKGKGSIRNLFSNAVPKRKKDVAVKLEEDDILADVLGDLDTDKTPNSGSANSIISTKENRTKLKDTNEAAAVKEYMQNFINSIKKKDEPKDRKMEASDDEFIDRILKPVQNGKTKSENALQISEDHLQVESRQDKPKLETIALLETESKAIVSEKKADRPEEYSDMDFSILNDNENQFVDAEPASAKPPKAKTAEMETSDFKNLLDNWENICNMDNFEEENSVETAEESIDEENLKMWYWDAWEDQYKRPGQVFLFGKIGNQKETKSVCVHIENVDRCLYLLPREYMLDLKTNKPTSQKVTFIDVYKEFNEVITNELGLTTFRSRKVTKNFSFHVPDVDVPESCEYLEVRYEGKFPAPNIKKKYSSIAHIFGTNTQALETCLLECKIKGPCWLNIKKFTVNKNPLSWCKLEAICNNIKMISVADEQKTQPPPMVILTTNVRTALNPKTTKNEIVMISCLVNNRFCVDKPAPNPPFNRHFCGFTRPVSQNFPLDLNAKLAQYKSTKTTKLESERALLSWFLATFQNIDPDLIVAHDANDCQLDAISDRIATIKIPMWSRLGRLRVSQPPAKRYLKDMFIGRLICDVKSSAEELVKSKSYDLEALCTTVLKLKEGERIDISNEDLCSMYEKSDSLLKLITLTMQDCSYILRLMCEMNVIPLALQITNVCGNLMSRTLQGGRAERNEFLLLHAFTEKNYIVPDKKGREVHWEQNDTTTQMNKPNATRKKAAYSGGLVLEPVKGFYDKLVLLMDFNSLYPSIIQEYNICFTTVDVPEKEDEIAAIPDSGLEQGVLPRQIRRLVESRREVKKLMANPDLDADLQMQYNIRQLALKLTANSMYGCLGFEHSRFFAQHLAALVTFKGREILTNTKGIVQKLNYDVIYGDTDSIMINTNITDYDQVFKIGHNIKQSINKIYRQIELDIDGVFKYLLLLKKKKYAAVTMSKNKSGEIILRQEIKGLDIVRRDWSQIAVMAGRIVLDEIFSDNPLDEKIEHIHGHLEKFKQNVLDGTVPHILFNITKKLMKAPRDYTSIVTLPHVQMALRMNLTRNKRYKRGDVVGYIICEDGTTNPAMQRAYHLEELRSDEKLKIDTAYYLAQQIHPIVSRICEPLEGTDASRIAACLGLDPNKFKVAAQRVQRERMEEGDGVALAKTTLQKYRQCEKFKFTCVVCKTENVMASAFKRVDSSYIAVLDKCANPECSSLPHNYMLSIRNEIVLSVRKFLQRFYENWMVCDDPACNSNTRIYTHVTANNRPVCMACKQGFLIRQYSERDLFTQLSYYQYIFDLSKHENKNTTLSPETEGAYNFLKEAVDLLLENSAYCRISLLKLFLRLNPSVVLDIQLPNSISEH